MDRASGKQLDTLLKQSPRERLQHLRDPALTARDRRRLHNSIHKELPRRAAPPPQQNGMLRLHPIRRRWRGLVIGSLFVILCLGLAILAWRNTGSSLVRSDTTWRVVWTLPNGRLLDGAWRAGYPAVAMQSSDGDVTLRYWLNGLGYAQTTVSAGWLSSHIRVRP